MEYFEGGAKLNMALLTISVLVISSSVASAQAVQSPDEPLVLDQTVNHASLRSPGSDDLVVVSWPWFYGHMSPARYFFFTPGRTQFTDHTQVRISPAFLRAEHLDGLAKSSEEYISELDGDNCVIQKLFIFAANERIRTATIIVMHNPWEDPAGKSKSLPATKLIRLSFRTHYTGYSTEEQFVPTKTETLDRYYCQYDSGDVDLLYAIKDLAQQN